MAMRNFYNEIKGMKVKENAFKRGLDNYHAKYIETNSIDPLYHVCFGGMAFSYLVALPEERRHLEHQQHAKEHGGH
nr:Protein phosphatase methylesterase [Ipomoea batatas]GMC50034.1 Protein phosphatase methylesterase [Ipomoea batatas]GMC51971.1 Protein phosphatase methylesterase [Ipomoea batatas]GMC53916.1 Protein phosphatase methylesterase [Ipomoea batatas]